MAKTADPIARLRRCIRRERKANETLQAIIGWYPTDEEEKAVADARRATNAALREIAAQATNRGRHG